MAKIFISYRRQDSAAMAGRIYDRLQAHFGNDAVFMDIDNIPFGVNFRKHIAAAVSQCDVVLAVIGTKWAGETAANRRLDEPRDFVRIELESALYRNLPVIPILIDHARMPGEAELPASLATLADYNAIDVDQGRDFHHHVDLLIKGIEYHIQRDKIPDARDLSQSQEETAKPPIAKVPERAPHRLISEVGPYRPPTAGGEHEGIERPTVSGRAAQSDERATYEPPDVPTFFDWRSPRLTRVLATIHLVVGVLLFAFCAFVFVGFCRLILRIDRASPSDFTTVGIFSIIITPAAALEVIGGYGLWRTKRWSSWLACYSVGVILAVIWLLFLSFPGGFEFLAVATFLSIYIPILSLHLWTRPKLITRQSVLAGKPVEQHR
jgi:hypothetical protein